MQRLRDAAARDEPGAREAHQRNDDSDLNPESTARRVALARGPLRLDVTPTSAMDFYHLPPNRAVEMGTQVEIWPARPVAP